MSRRRKWHPTWWCQIWCGDDVVTLEMTPTEVAPDETMSEMIPNVTVPDKWVSVREEERDDFAI